MLQSEYSALIDSGLGRAAKHFGDITPMVMERFYCTHPEAADSFKYHNLSGTNSLEGDMVANAIAFLMDWPDRQSEVSIAIRSSVPHHIETLHVEPGWYGGLINSVIGLILELVPEGNELERAAWYRVRNQLAQEIQLAIE